MMLYALGALELFDGISDIESVTVPVLPCEDSCGAWRPLAEKVTGRKPNKDGITCLCIIS